MAEKDTVDFYLPKFEKKIKRLGILNEYGDKTGRNAILGFEDSQVLFERYIKTVYTICSEHKEIDKTYNRILERAANLIEGKRIHFDFVNKTGTFDPKYDVQVAEEETSRVFKKLVKNFNMLLNMPSKETAFAFFLYKRNGVYIQKFEKDFWYGAERTWSVELAFFMLMKFNEILNSKGFELI